MPRSIERVCTVEQFLVASPLKRLDLARKQIEYEKDGWNQRTWVTIVDRSVHNAHVLPGVLDQNDNVCGTAACLAGWVVILAGDRIVADGVCMAGDGQGAISHRSDVLLGLEGCEHALYDEDNSIEDIDREIAAIRSRMTERVG